MATHTPALPAATHPAAARLRTWTHRRSAMLARAAAAATAIQARPAATVAEVAGGPPRLTTGEDTLAACRHQQAQRFQGAATGRPEPPLPTPAALASAVDRLLRDQPADADQPHILVLPARFLLALPAETLAAHHDQVAWWPDCTFVHTDDLLQLDPDTPQARSWHLPPGESSPSDDTYHALRTAGTTAGRALELSRLLGLAGGHRSSNGSGGGTSSTSLEVADDRGGSGPGGG